jgi:hypothetical protein
MFNQIRTRSNQIKNRLILNIDDLNRYLLVQQIEKIFEKKNFFLTLFIINIIMIFYKYGFMMVHFETN